VAFALDQPSARLGAAPPSTAAIVPDVATPELSGVAIVGAGSFNPAIFHPRWFAAKELIPDGLAEHAMAQQAPQAMVVTPQLAVFVADWLSVQVTQQQAVFSTVDRGRDVDLRDVVRGIFELLPETPMDAIGINLDSHVRTDSEGAWHAFGDLFLPKGFWEPLFQDGDWKQRADGQRVGMRTVVVEVERSDPELRGRVRIEVAPSIRVVPHGVFIGINGHFQLAQPGSLNANGADAVRVLMEQWDSTREREDHLVAHILEAL
jgi:hypothetical protein